MAESKMTQDEIIRMAYAAGAVKGEHTVLKHQWFEFTQEQLERFTALVAEATKRDVITLCKNWDFNVQGLIRQIEDMK